jgi:N-acetylglucosaminyldiphosphoundecaprenol N-acetyl-beta-D-mannosaminyltransferase
MQSDAHSTFAIAGIAIDVLDMDGIISRIDASALSRKPTFISTVNTNFLVNSRVSQPFRNSLMVSDLCTVDGIGMLMVCKLLSCNRVTRVSGSDMLDRLLLRAQSMLGRPLRIFFFGGMDGIADAARHKVNQMPSSSVCCVGALNPGFGSMDEISRDDVIRVINDANADFLIVSLGAERGQEWIMRNRPRLNTPVCAHLGAALNFVAGSIQRAPVRWRSFGLEWLWRIRQEPYLARRYWNDAKVFGRLLALNVAPMVAVQLWDRLVFRLRPRPFTIRVSPGEAGTMLSIGGPALHANARAIRQGFAAALERNRPVTIDCSELTAIDASIIGEIMRLRRDLEFSGRPLRLRKLSGGIAWRLRTGSLGWLG